MWRLPITGKAVGPGGGSFRSSFLCFRCKKAAYTKVKKRKMGTATVEKDMSN